MIRARIIHMQKFPGLLESKLARLPVSHAATSQRYSHRATVRQGHAPCYFFERV